MTINECKTGQRVRVRQTIDRRDRDWESEVVGVVQAVEMQETGSWYAHSRDGKLWLQRLRLVKDDGEVTLLNIDVGASIELLDDVPGGS